MSTVIVEPPLRVETYPEDPRSAAGRLEALADDGSLRLLATAADSGVVSGVARLAGVDTAVFATEPSRQGGAMGAAGCAAIVAAYDLALAQRIPIVGVWHSGGARLAEGVAALDGVGRVFAAMTRASGRVPQLSVVLGPAAGGAAYGPALTDVVILGPAGRIFVTGPDVVKTVTGEDVDMLSLGGPEPHGRRSGVVHLTTKTDSEAFTAARNLVGIFSRRGKFGPVAERDFAALLPDSPRRAYDVHPLVDRLLDEPGIELQARWAPNVVTTLGRFGGHSVGVLANNPLRLGGCLDAAAGEKAARFVRCCDAFGLPLIVLVDVPGYLPGVGQEWDGVVRRGAKLLHAFAEAEVPRVTLVTRKAYGGALIAMNSKSLGATAVFAWPDAELAVMGAQAAVRVLHRRRLATVPAGDRPELEAELADEHQRLAGGLDRAIELGVVDAVVQPGATRGALLAVLRAASGERSAPHGRHANIPL